MILAVIMIKLSHSQSDPQGKIVARTQNLVASSLQGSASYVLSIHYDRIVLSIRYDRLNGSIRIGLSCSVGCASNVALYIQYESMSFLMTAAYKDVQLIEYNSKLLALVVHISCRLSETVFPVGLTVTTKP